MATYGSARYGAATYTRPAAPPRVLVRGDSYGAARPFWTYTLLDANDAPMNLQGCTVRTTYRTALVAPAADPTDATAVLAHTLVVDMTGTAATSQGLVLVGDAGAGTIEERLTAAETRALPLLPLLSDIEVTDAGGEIFSFIFADTVQVRDAITHRVT